MVHPAFKVVTPETPLPTALTPVYPSTVQLPQAYLRKAVAAALRARRPRRARCRRHRAARPADPARGARPSARACRPALAAAALEDRVASGVAAPEVRRAAGPAVLAAARAARARSASARRRSRAAHGELHDALLAALPFALHARAAAASAPRSTPTSAARMPMHRLLQGDVGSGKTVVAALAAARAIDAGWQCALMAPTEILAEQHSEQARRLARAARRARVAWLTGSRKGKARDAMLAQVASGEAALVVGTHAVIEEEVRFARSASRSSTSSTASACPAAALRGKLRAAGRLEPHLLMMTATPIPRTLAMTLLRRPRRQHDRRAAARPHAGRHQAVRRQRAATR